MTPPDKHPDSLTYRDAGVDIDVGNRLVERIKPLARSTRRAGSDAGLGGFGAVFDLAAAGYKDPLLITTTDGVGTKLLVAKEVGDHSTVGIDLVAMCVNDLVVQGAEPLLFLDYYATSKLDVDEAAAVVGGIAAGCKEAGCALVGGETAELPGLYAPGDYDLAGFSVGAVSRGDLLPKPTIGAGDVILGLASSGIHSNGFSLVRRVIKAAGKDFTSPAPFATGKAIGPAILTPTRIYVKSCLAVVKSGLVKAFAHITGGGLYENIPRVLPEGLVARIDAKSWDLPPVFRWLKKAGNVADDEMARTFNCGIGMMAVVAKADADKVARLLREQRETVFVIGEVVAEDRTAPGTQIRNMESAWRG